MNQAASQVAAVSAGNGGGSRWASDDSGGGDRGGIGHEQESRKTSTGLLKTIREHIPFFGAGLEEISRDGHVRLCRISARPNRLKKALSREQELEVAPLG